MDVGSLTAVSVTNGVLVYLAFMPSPSELVDDEPDDNLRINEVSAGVVTIGLGMALSFIGKSGAPLLASIVAVVALTAGYEYLARTTDMRLARARVERMAKNVRV